MKIILHVLDADEKLCVEVNSLWPIHQLESFLPKNSNYYFLYKGYCLVSALTFAFYGMRDNDHIYPVVMKISKERVLCYKHSNIALEHGKLKDWYLNRVESSRIGNMLMTRKLMKFIDNEMLPPPKNNYETILIDNSPNSPSTDELPIFWRM